MLNFKQFITERVLSIGLNDKHEKLREKHRQEIHDMIHKAYSHPDLGGYSGLKSGSDEESKAIHHDISNSIIKATRRDGKITSVNLYKKQHGRKSIALATDGSEQGKKDLMKNKHEDDIHKRAWGEVSGKVAHIHKKIGTPDIPASRAKELLNKDVISHPDNVHYDRKIGNHMHTKKMVGHPKVNQ